MEADNGGIRRQLILADKTAAHPHFSNELSYMFHETAGYR